MNDIFIKIENVYTNILELLVMERITQQLSGQLNEEQEKIKLKYGDKTVLTIYRHLTNIDLLIFNVDIDFINLLDIIHYNLGKIIVDGFIKQTNCVNYEKYFNKSIKYFSDKEKHIFNITIHNCRYKKLDNS